ncbi:lysylphosphatidylglycerol synthase transmembrane domain-containing protein [Salinisphaera sp. SPP-AMP-43]|uniref:lysylphosphatidylglycerol synthase transmembrane domain-containing protein n=1 Tax=Salinisphaera sp. SPP-AMP-43 TaxID=3121288 RepID=UPI003C6E2C41
MPRLTTVIVSLLIAALLYFTLVAGIDGARTWAAMQRLDWLGWMAICGLSLFNYALRFLRWHGYLRWLGHRLPLIRHALIYVSGFALTTTPGKAGEGVRAVYLARRNVPYAHTVAALFAERLLDLLSILVLSLLAVLSFTGYVYWIAAPLAVIVGLLAIMHNRTLLKAAQKRVEQPQNLVGRVLQVAVHAWERAFVLLSWKPLVSGLAIGCVAWAAEGVSVYLIAERLGLDVALTLAIGIYATSMLIGALSFLPGGLGSTEAAMTLLLKLSGVAAGAALSVTLIARIATLWLAVVLGLICLGGLELERRRQPQSDTQQGHIT